MENVEYVKIIAKDMVNEDSTYLNNEGNYNLENDIKNDGFVVVIHGEN